MVLGSAQQIRQKLPLLSPPDPLRAQDNPFRHKRQPQVTSRLAAPLAVPLYLCYVIEPPDNGTAPIPISTQAEGSLGIITLC